MKSFNYTITDPVGIHARPAGLLVKEVKNYASLITVSKDGKSVDAKKLMMLMGLGVKCGDEVTVEVTGEDEESAVAALEEFFKANL
ncbi:MAG: HPr family phosphocarrier protein [Tyzzerella sp.]|nr:HPr family phosphocarrier protein [Tyzzerella sp.]